MANDIIEIGFSIDRDQQLVKAVSKVNTLEGRLNKLSKAIVDGSISDKRRSQSLIAMGRELKAVTGMTGQAAYGAVKKYTNAQVEAYKVEKQLSDQKRVLAAQTKLDTAEKERSARALASIRAQVDPMVAANQRLKKSEDQLKAAVASRLITQKQADVLMGKLRAQTLAMSESQMAATKASNRLGVVTQQAGYQVSDFVVQVQSGQNVLVAFSQQASQLVGVLPLVASQLGLTARAAIGLSAALGIAIPVVSAAAMILLNMKSSAEKAEKEVDEYKKTIDSLSSSISNLTDVMELNHGSVDFAITKYGRLTKDVKDFLKVTKELAEYEVIEETGKAFEQLINTKEFIKVTGELSGIKEDIVSAQAKLKEEIASGQEEDILNNLREEIAKSEAAYASLSATLDNMPEGKLMALSDEFLAASEGRNIQGMTDAIAGIRTVVNELPADVRLNMLKMVVQMEAQLRRLQSSVEKTTELDPFGGLGESNELLRESVSLTNQEARARANFLQLVNNQKRDYTVLNAQQQQQIDNQIALFERSQELTEEIGQGAKEALILADVDISKPITEAAKQAAMLASDLGISLNAALSLKSLRGLKIYSGRGSGTEYTDPEGTGDQGDSDTKTGPKKTTIEDTIKSYRRQLQIGNKLIGLTGQRRREEEVFLDLLHANEDAQIKTSETRLRELAKEMAAMEERSRVVDEARQQQEDLANHISGAMENAFMSIVDGTMTVKDAFRAMAADIIRELYRVLVVKRLVSAATSFFGFADGGAFQGGSQIQAYADGGVVGGPTFFPMAGGKTGLMGEAGPEAIMPLKRGKDGKLGVSVDGKSSGDVSVVNHFHFQANGDDSVKRIIAQEAPKIAKMTEAQILDSRRRGGQMRKAFA